MAQARALGVGFDAVVCASGSALTHAGVLVGLRAVGETMPIYGISVRRDARRQGARVAQLAAQLAAMIERPAFDAGDVEVCDTVHAPGYGRLNDAVREAIAMAARLKALFLDPVYTGKAMAGLIAHVRAGLVKSTPPIILSRRTSPHPIQRTCGCGADGGEPIAGGVDRLGTDSARYREPTRTVGAERPT